MAESAFLTAVAGYLTGLGLAPAPKSVGVSEPAAAGTLPALVLSLESTSRAGNGLGERSAVVTGALPVSFGVDLASPVLPGDPSTNLLSSDRKVLTLAHGGQVRTDGTSGSLGNADIQVTLNNAPVTLVTGTPAAGQVKADPITGQLTFGTALPMTGEVDADYFLGQWEQRVVRIQGVLRVDVCGADVAAAATLSQAVLDALAAPAARTQIKRLVSLSATALSSIGLPEAVVNLRRRTVRFAFTFENEINQPDSSGGIIRKIPVNTLIGA